MISTFYIQKSNKVVYNTYYCVTEKIVNGDSNSLHEMTLKTLSAGFNCLHNAHHSVVP